MDQWESATMGHVQRVWRLAVASTLGRYDSHAKPQPHCAIENMDHLLREQRSLPYFPQYRSVDISRQISDNRNRCRKDCYQAWNSKRLTQYTLNTLGGWGSWRFRKSAAAQDDHSTQNTIFAGQKGWAWTSKANATSEMTKHTVNMIDGAFLLNPERAKLASLFCNLIHQSTENTWIGIRQPPSFYSNYINLEENKSFLSSHVQPWPIQTTESNYAVLVCLFYLAGCSANNVLLHFNGQVFGRFQVNGRSWNLMYTILQHWKLFKKNNRLRDF